MICRSRPNRPRVLVTDGAAKHTLGAVRDLAAAGFAVDVISPPWGLAALSRFARRSRFAPRHFCEEGMAAFVDYLSADKPDALLAIGSRSVQLVSDHRDTIAAHTALVLPPSDALAATMDEHRTQAVAAVAGVAVPATWPLADDASVAIAAAEATFPLVLKRSSELHPGRPVYVSSASQVAPAVRAWVRAHGQRPIGQEYVDGDGEGFFALYDRGVCKRVFMHRRLRQTPPTGGASCCAESIRRDDLHRAGRAMLDALAWHGVAMVEFKRCRHTGRLVLMEVNPKFWGSLDLALAAGVSFPADAVRVALGEKIAYAEDYREGLRFHWPFDGGELHHVLAAPHAVFDVLRDCVDPRVRSNLTWRDPLPSLASIANGFRTGLREWVRRL